MFLALFWNRWHDFSIDELKEKSQEKQTDSGRGQNDGVDFSPDRPRWARELYEAKTQMIRIQFPKILASEIDNDPDGLPDTIWIWAKRQFWG